MDAAVGRPRLHDRLGLRRMLSRRKCAEEKVDDLRDQLRHRNTPDLELRQMRSI